MSIDELIKQLAAAIEKADQSDLMDGGRYFVEHLTDLTRCRHGETGEYLREADGQLVELLWNNRHTFLNTLRHVAPLVEAIHSYRRAVRSYSMPFVGYTGLIDEAAGELTKALAPFGDTPAQKPTIAPEVQPLVEALSDILSGWRYIRQVHGDLPGVGWERCEASASAALENALAAFGKGEE